MNESLTAQYYIAFCHGVKAVTGVGGEGVSISTAVPCGTPSFLPSCPHSPASPLISRRVAPSHSMPALPAYPLIAPAAETDVQHAYYVVLGFVKIVLVAVIFQKVHK